MSAVFRQDTVVRSKRTGDRTKGSAQKSAQLATQIKQLEKMNVALADVVAAAFIENPRADLAAYHIAPEAELKTNTTTQNYDILINDYNLGLKQGEQFLNESKTSV